MHCTAGSQKQTLKDLLNEFRAKGWKSPGYHYVVFPDGKVEQLLDENKISNGVQGYNSTSINIAYVGGIDGKGRPCDNRTNDQKSILRTLLGDLKERYPNAKIMGHRDIWGKNPSKWKKQCPCFDAEEEYSNIGKQSVNQKVTEIKVPNSPIEPKSWLDKIKKLKPW